MHRSFFRHTAVVVGTRRHRIAQLSTRPNREANLIRSRAWREVQRLRLDLGLMPAPSPRVERSEATRDDIPKAALPFVYLPPQGLIARSLLYHVIERR